MKNHCKANPCCGDPYACEVPLPQHRSGLWFHNSEEYRRKADQKDTPPPQTNVMGDIVSVLDGGNAITLHFAEIKSAKAFRDMFPAEQVRPSPSDQEVGP